MNDIRSKLLRLLDVARYRPDVNELEIEFRLSAEPLLFYRLFAECSQQLDVIATHSTRSVTRTRSDGQSRLRSEYCHTGRCLVGSLFKTRLAQPIDFHTQHGRLRLDVQNERKSTNCVLVAAPTHTRRKERVAFRFQAAPHWVMEFTRVLASENGSETVGYEIEIELDKAALAAWLPTTAELADEAIVLLRRSLFK
jgi:hypothetical protein